MKTNFFTTTLLLLLLINVKLNSQTVTWGNENRTDAGYYAPTIFGENGNYFYSYGFITINDAIYNFKVERHNKKNLTRDYQVLFSEYIGKNEVIPKQVVLLNEKVIVFGSLLDKKTGEYKLLPYGLDEKNEKFVVLNPNFIVSTKNNKETLFKSSGVESYFSINISPDHSKLVIYHGSYDYDKKVYTHLINLYDKDLNLLLTKEESFDESSTNFIYHNFIIDNDGSVYVRKIISSSNQYIVSYDANREYEKWEEKIDLSKMDRNSTITNLQFNITSNNDLTIIGNYTHDKNIDGCFFLKVDKHSKEIVGSKINEFSQDYKDKFIKTKTWYFQSEKGLKDVFNRMKIINKNDGGQIVIAEVHTKAYGGNASYYDLFGDLMLYNLSPTGDLIWANKIPKNQKYAVNFPTKVGGEGHFYYMSFIDNQNLYIIFNDNSDNLEIKDYEVAKQITSYEEAIPVVVSINLTAGEMKKRLYKELVDELTYIKPITNFQEKQGTEGIFLSKSRKIYKYCKIKFE